MKATFSRLICCLALLASASDPLWAGGDWFGGAGSVKDYGGGVPVPAPIPVPINQPQWYLRIDASAAFGDTSGADESGMVFGEGDANFSASSTFGTSPSWIDDQFGKHAMYGVGAGYRWRDWFRTDVTGESMRDASVTIDGAGSRGLLDNVGAPVVGETYDVVVRDTTSIRGAVFLANGYFDIGRWGPLTPYVGGGVGFAVVRIKRENSTTETESSGPSTIVDVSSSSTDDDYTFAAAASAGISYAFSDITELDLSYRYLYIGDLSADLPVNGHASRVSLDPTGDHQVRAGLRFNID